jgi:hypothetical protein
MPPEADRIDTTQLQFLSRDQAYIYTRSAIFLEPINLNDFLTKMCMRVARARPRIAPRDPAHVTQPVLG